MSELGAIKAIVGGLHQAATSLRDCDALSLVLSECYGATSYSGYTGYGFDDSEYSGQEITTVQLAIMYAISKIHARGTHHKASAAVSLTVTGVTSAVGGIGGSIIPGAGTIVGVAAGAGIGFGVSKGITYSWRGLKKFKKYVTGSLGKHRRQAAAILSSKLFSDDSGTKDFVAAVKAVHILIGEQRLNYFLNGGWGSGAYDEDELRKEIYESLNSWRYAF